MWPPEQTLLGAFFMPATGGEAMVTWTLVTVGYVAPAVPGAVGLTTTGEAVARWGRAATRAVVPSIRGARRRRTWPPVRARIR